MSEAAKINNSGPHPLRRLLRKASRSKTSISTVPEPNAEGADVQAEEGQPRLERIASIALTIPDGDTQTSTQAPVVVEEVKEPQTPVLPKEGKKRASLVDKFKGMAVNRKDKKVVPLLEESVEQSISTVQVPPTPNDPTQTAPNGIRPEDIAKRIRDLLTSSPPFYPTTLVASEMPSSPKRDGNETLMGPKFLEALSDQNLMAGSSKQESVWQILERTKFSFQPANQVVINASADNTDPDSSIMLCAPLIPDENSKVELAEYHLVKVPLDELDEQMLSAAGWWPPWEWGKKPKPSEPPTKPVRVWIPSTTKVSVQFCWWGFRIWLPPPVMKVLSDKQVEAVKRAAMIATALGWLVANIPTAALPPQLLPVLAVAKALVPIIGYVSGFIAWYWSTVQGFDKGSGVVLSATWLLPIALIPGNWDYTPPPDPPATPAPPAPSTPSAPTPPPAPPPAPSAPPTSPPTNPTEPPDPPIGITPPPSIPTGAENDRSPVIVIPPVQPS